MLFYVAIVLALTLAAGCGGLYFYAMFLEARGRQLSRRIAELERVNAELAKAVRVSFVAAPAGEEATQELWPEVLDDGGDFSVR